VAKRYTNHVDSYDFVCCRRFSLLPRSASNKNFATCLVADFAKARKRLRPAKPPREPRGTAARLARAIEWQWQLDVLGRRPPACARSRATRR
jgi:hypothetical protein